MLKYILFHIALPLIAGVSLYIFFRPGTLPVFDALANTEAYNIIMHMRTTIHWSPPGAVIYNLPDALWLYSFLSSINALISMSDGALHTRWVYVPFALALLWESIQFFFSSFGTFDMLDIASYLLTTITFFILHPIKKTLDYESYVKSTSL